MGKSRAAQVSSILALTVFIAPTAYGISATHGDSGITRVKVTTSSSNSKINVSDTAADNRWVSGKYKVKGDPDATKTLTNDKGASSTVSFTPGQQITHIKACYSGNFLAPMQCTDWKS